MRRAAWKLPLGVARDDWHWEWLEYSTYGCANAVNMPSLLITLPSLGQCSALISMSVYLSARCILEQSQVRLQIFSVHLTCGHGSVLFLQNCDTLCTSGFVDDNMFAHNGYKHGGSMDLTP